ncbi:Na+/H+ antiporter NhaA [Hyphomicrobium sp. MC1]|uniref:Na+/H+ antiporter NhaA n=1 Tax=Hyphomicrobium sp. (strain MC1) TaxID=717785 RepID=UPI000213E962|nr:Na+/H+ antiporter NhaA [Hyphomicrobium sp. MC1]CCB67801.1 sodium:proton antiporter (NhaA family) [Hyphomicrobium sp. MC1]
MKPESSAEGISREVLASLVLLAAAVLALFLANSPLHDTYEHILTTKVQLGVAPFSLTKEIHHWINDGLMVIFFLVVGLEIKREAIRGALSKPSAAMLPIFGAIGGMAVPALIYASVNFNNAEHLRGWAIPAATDIAFAVGVMALLGKRVPPTLKVFLLALAIIDDLGAILIIAFFYTYELSFTALGLAATGVAVMAVMNRLNVMRVWPYLLVGAFVWLCVLKSGVHATIAGVVTALMIPCSSPVKGVDGPLPALEHTLSPWVSFGIMPIFALANAGLALGDLSMNDMLSQIPVGIALGLFLGKPLGIYGAVRAAIASGLGEMPHGASRMQLFGTAILGGIGFTMSLFIGLLAFPDPTLTAEVRLGVMAGSLLAAVVGYIVLVTSKGAPPMAEEKR